MLNYSDFYRYGAIFFLLCMLARDVRSYPLNYNMPWKRAPERQLTWQDLLSAPQYKRYNLNALLDQPQYQDYPDYYPDLIANQQIYPSLVNDLTSNYDELSNNNLGLYQSLLPYPNLDDGMYDDDQFPYTYQDGVTQERPTVWYDTSFDIPEQEEIDLDDDFMRDVVNEYKNYKPSALPAEPFVKSLPEVDEEVMELKSLAHPQKKNVETSPTFDKFSKPESLRISDRKGTSTVAPPNAIAAPKEKTTVPTTSATFVQRGQKEVPLLRPANPIRQPFSLHAEKEAKKMQTTTQTKDQEQSQAQINRNKQSKKGQEGQQRTQKSGESVYDTIKRLLAMEKKLQQAEEKEAKIANTDFHQHKKRFVSDEESLVSQLDNLKRVMA